MHDDYRRASFLSTPTVLGLFGGAPSAAPATGPVDVKQAQRSWAYRLEIEVFRSVAIGV